MQTFAVRLLRVLSVSTANLLSADNRTSWNLKLSQKALLIKAGLILNVTLSFTPSKTCVHAHLCMCIQIREYLTEH